MRKGSPGPVISPSGRSVVQDIFDLLEDLRGELINDLKSCQVLLKLTGLGGSKDGGGDVFSLQGPGNSQLNLRAAELLGDLSDTVQLGNSLGLLLFSTHVGVEEEALVLRVLGEPGVLRDAFVVLTGQDARAERGPDGGSQSVVVEEVSVVALDFVSDEHVVLTLLSDGPWAANGVTEVDGLHELDGWPGAGGPVEGLTAGDDSLDGLDGLDSWSALVVSVAEDDVYIVELEVLQGSVETLDEPLPGTTHVVDSGGVLWELSTKDLGGYHVVRTRDVESSEGDSELSLSLAVPIGLSGVKEVDAVVPGELHQGIGSLLGFLIILSVGHVSKGKSGDLDAGSAKVDVFHLVLFFGGHLLVLSFLM